MLHFAIVLEKGFSGRESKSGGPSEKVQGNAHRMLLAGQLLPGQRLCFGTPRAHSSKAKYQNYVVIKFLTWRDEIMNQMTVE